MRKQTEFSIRKEITKNKYEVTEQDIKDNFERVKKGLPLTIPLIYLNGRLKRRHYSREWFKENPEKYKEYKTDKREKYRNERPLEMMACRNCKNRFMPSKRGVFYCSRKCRNKDYYRKNAEKWNNYKKRR